MLSSYRERERDAITISKKIGLQKTGREVAKWVRGNGEKKTEAREGERGGGL